MREAQTQRLNELAADIGRLRQRYPHSGAFLADRMTTNLQALALMLEPSAAELAAWYAPGDNQAVLGALETVDAWDRAFCSRLKVKPT